MNIEFMAAATYIRIDLWMEMEQRPLSMVIVIRTRIRRRKTAISYRRAVRGVAWSFRRQS